MQQFVSHYLLLGVSKVIIFDNSNPESEESKYFRKVVQPFVELGYVEVVDNFVQSEKPGEAFDPINTFKKCLSLYKNQFDWIAQFDRLVCV